MLKNFIFDFGNVLMLFDPVGYATKIMGGDREKGKKLFDMTIDNKKIWDGYDLGFTTEEETTQLLRDDAEGEYRDGVSEFMKNIDGMFSPNEEMEPVLLALKERGYNTFLISDFPREMFERLSARCPALRLVDHKIVSYAVHLKKPHRGIYEYVLNTYGLDPAECVFTDDYGPNVQTAADLGILTHTFTDADNYIKFLKEHGVI